MRSIGFWVLTLSAAFLIGVLPAPAAAAGDKSTELGRAAEEIKAARLANAGRIETAAAKRDELRRQVLLLKEEIAQERRNSGVGSFRGAPPAGRIANNLRLIQQLCAYIDQLELRAARLQEANLRLDFLLRQAQDDLLLLKALNDAGTAGLAARIRGALEENALQGEKPLVVVSELRFRDLEAIWNETALESKR